MTTQTEVLKYLKHFAVLAGLGAASIIVVALLQLAGTFNTSSLPIVWQGVLYLILPVVIAAGLKLKSEIDAELAAQLAAKEIADLKSKNVSLSKQLTLDKPDEDESKTSEHFNTF